VWLADRAGIATNRQHWLKADAATELHARGVASADFSSLLRRLNQARKDYWYDGEELNAEELAEHLSEVEALVHDAEQRR
jgi:hypothetical protein